MINVEVEKNSNENTASLLRRFTRRIRGSGVLNRVKSTRYYKRPASKAVKKKTALKRILKQEKHEELVKLGKIPADGRNDASGRQMTNRK